MESIDQLFTIVTDEFCKLNEPVNSLLVNYIVHDEMLRRQIPHKFILGYYNHDETSFGPAEFGLEELENPSKYSYKHVWIEYDDIIYDLTHYINDKMLSVLPIDRANARFYQNKKNLYTAEPKWKRADLDTVEDRDYDFMFDRLFTQLLVGNDADYITSMPKKYGEIYDRIYRTRAFTNLHALSLPYERVSAA